MKLLIKKSILICKICGLLFLLSCKENNISKTEFVLGTYCTVTIYDTEHNSTFYENLLNEVFTRLREINNLFSTRIAASDISRINAGAGVEPVQVNKDVFFLIEISIYFSNLSFGAFNPAIGPVVNLWNIPDNPRIPSQQEIDEALSVININNIELNNDSLSVFLKHNGMTLDLGGIAKGYAADEASKILIEAGIRSAIIDLGGNVVVIGKNKNNNPWRVGIQDPLKERGNYREIIEVQIPDNKKQMSIVTSGGYERFFEAEGKRYHHIFSPITGYPVENDLLSVTIITENSMTADALSTAVFVLGYDKGKELIDSIDNVDVKFLFKE